jgi:hypothetical protein
VEGHSFLYSGRPSTLHSDDYSLFYQLIQIGTIIS